jgi:hypothetical protein
LLYLPPKLVCIHQNFLHRVYTNLNSSFLDPSFLEWWLGCKTCIVYTGLYTHNHLTEVHHLILDNKNVLCRANWFCLCPVIGVKKSHLSIYILYLIDWLTGFTFDPPDKSPVISHGWLNLQVIFFEIRCVGHIFYHQ